ncbi:MAG: TetR/AcrR family transcriptional regulator [Myxococcaceae bacterium]|nr:TetR/AcrR family transcriptional regulator [Myxococcaceae bacterium]
MSGDPKEILKRARARMAAELRKKDDPDDAFGEVKRPKVVVPGVLETPVAPNKPLWDAAHPPGRTVSVSSVERDQVISTAITLFARGGFRKVSLDEVAALAGVSKAVVLAVAPSKEALLYEAVSREVETFLAEARRWVHPRVEAMQLLQQIAERAFEYIGHHPLLMQLMLGLLSEVAPEWDAKFYALRMKFSAVIEDALKVGIQQKRLRADMDVEMVASIMFEMHVATYVLHLRGDPDKEQRAARRRAVALDLLYRGLRA